MSVAKVDMHRPEDPIPCSLCERISREQMMVLRREDKGRSIALCDECFDATMLTLYSLAFGRSVLKATEGVG